MNDEINLEEEVMPKGKKERLKSFKGITPLQAIRRRCLDCSGYNQKEVRECYHNKPIPPFDIACPLHPYRMGKGRPKLKVIKAYCIQCQGEHGLSSLYVKECTDKDCSLYPFRLGHNPNISEETKQKRRERALRAGLGKQYPTANSL